MYSIDLICEIESNTFTPTCVSVCVARIMAWKSCANFLPVSLSNYWVQNNRHAAMRVRFAHSWNCLLRCARSCLDICPSFAWAYCALHARGRSGFVRKSRPLFDEKDRLLLRAVNFHSILISIFWLIHMLKLIPITTWLFENDDSAPATFYIRKIFVSGRSGFKSRWGRTSFLVYSSLAVWGTEMCCTSLENLSGL